MTTATPSTTHLGGEGLDLGTLNLMLEALGDFVAAELPEAGCSSSTTRTSARRTLVRAMCSDALGIQLVFIPEEYGGMGGNAFDSYRVCERMARVDIGLAHGGLRDVPGQRPDPGRGHRGAEEEVAGPHRRARASSSPTARPSPRPAATSAR